MANSILVHEADEACGKGVIALPGHMGKSYGRVEKVPKHPRSGYLKLPSGIEIPWTPADQIGYN